VCPKIEWESKSIIIAICLLSMVGCTNSKSVKNQSYTDTTNVPTYQDIKNAESVQGIQNKL
jgi:outer membrane lipoprotein SlyB